MVGRKCRDVSSFAPTVFFIWDRGYYVRVGVSNKNIQYVHNIIVVTLLITSLFLVMWDERYSEEGYVYGTEPNDFLASQSDQLSPNSKILCLAEGEGRNGVYLAKLGHSVLGVDSSSVGLQKARDLAEAKGVCIETQVADLKDFDIGEEKWDVVVSIFAHLPPPIRKSVHERVVKGLKKGCVIILEAYTPKQLEYKTGGPPVAEMMMTLDGLLSELKGLDFEFGRELERDVVEGKYHTGKAYTVQVFARKPK